ncbi:hypothetical protein EIKCOROL_01912 [Eikenella corrodens ATCC 23834]|uniref:Uncharacterized protein n=1 Tax=Eikenella corrodens ATCC 23834 TaxID=546274 RepID=C0DX09_EIKCO|nr:hypothetical protein EIKCOROL_01912 [Eikenella corrodens ATCC 23834]
MVKFCQFAPAAAVNGQELARKHRKRRGTGGNVYILFIDFFQWYKFNFME